MSLLRSNKLLFLKCDRSSDVLCIIIVVVSALSITLFYEFFITLILHICICLSVAFFHNFLVFMKFIICSKVCVFMNCVIFFMGFLNPNVVVLCRLFILP
jgi:hypothetical protein